jgi:membrane-associated PAP2 superfamily phosphatase
LATSGFLEYYRGDHGRRDLLRQAAAFVATALALLVVFGSSDLDRQVTRVFFDAARGGFPLTNAWWLKAVLHDAVRSASALAALAVLGVTVAAWLVPGFERARTCRHELAFVSVGALAAAATVGVLKHFSNHACPWEIADFGGFVPYRHLLAPHGALPPIEGCFPAAHPLAGYAWLSVAFALRPRAPQMASLAMRAVLVLGTVLGFVQIARGAHFLSHVLWSAWAVWGIDLALLALCRWPRLRAAPAERRALGLRH